MASSTLAEIHHRQQAVIESHDFDERLKPGTQTERLLGLVRCTYEGPFDRWPVSRRVNNARNDAPDLLLPLDG